MPRFVSVREWRGTPLPPAPGGEPLLRRGGVLMMAGKSPQSDSGFGCILLIIILGVGAIISAIIGGCDERKSRDLKPDYSSHPTEEGCFTYKTGALYSCRNFTVKDGIGYLTLERGNVLKNVENSLRGI